MCFAALLVEKAHLIHFYYMSFKKSNLQFIVRCILRKFIGPLRNIIYFTEKKCKMLLSKLYHY